MGLLHTKKQGVAGEYDFAKDPAAGAIGTFNTGVHIPSAAMINSFTVNTIDAPLSGGAATIDFGFQVYTNIGTFISAASLFPITAFGAFVPGTPIFGVNLILNPIKFGKFTKTVSGIDIIMTIAGAPITAGRFQFWCEYWENDL